MQLQVKQNNLFNPDYPDSPTETIYTTDKATWSLSSQYLTITADNNLDANYYD